MQEELIIRVGYGVYASQPLDARANCFQRQT